jgi:EAL domain-containing protein (putative c-di-GMP-specific phosphodiesterase class I)
LSYLRQLPLDVLKIDRSFVRDIESDADDRSIVDAVLAMGHSLSLEVVAEGVETQWQLDYLAARGCDRAQGYLIARPSAVGQLTFPPPGDTGARQPPTPAGGLRVV